MMNNENLIRELMSASGNNFAIVYQALSEAVHYSVQSGPVNKVNKEMVLAIIARIRNENENYHSRKSARNQSKR